MGTEPEGHWWHSQTTGRKLTAAALQRLTRDYWRQTGTLEQRARWYIDRLLPHELAYAESQRSLEYHPCHTLTLLVGYSLEPLFQAIGVFQPERIVLLLNEWYGSAGDLQRQSGISRGQDVEELIEDLLSPLLARPPADIDLYTTADRPDAVFRALCDHVLPDQRAGKPVIVDITGAKKSMDAGAFLFAAYADIPISYVDFADYDVEKRRPYGFTCRIGTLSNPYDAFQLRNWERVRRQYRAYRFRSAAQMLADLVEIMDKPLEAVRRDDPFVSPFQPEHVQAARKLLAVLRFYEAWDDGDYFRAQEQLTDFSPQFSGFQPPVAVELLGSVWPYAGDRAKAEAAARKLLKMHDKLIHPPHSIFQANDLLLTYAHDELERIQRLVNANEDNRSAVLRAAGLDELLLKARLVRLWHAGKEGWLEIREWDWQTKREGTPIRCRQLEPRLQRSLYGKLIAHDSVRYMRRALVGHQEPYWELPAFLRLDAGAEYRARPTDEAPCPIVYEQPAGLSGETLTELRNRAVHTYLYLTQPVAQAAVDLARANLAEFEQNWAELSGAVPEIDPGDMERLPWDQICELCGLHFLPLASQSKEEA